MEAYMHKFLIGAAIAFAFLGLFLTAFFVGGKPRAQTSADTSSKPTPSESPRDGYVLKANEGEVLQRGKGNTVTIKVDPKTGSPNMALGTQLLESGAGIPVHQHEDEDEVLFIHEGSGVAVLGNQRKTVGKGDTVFVPRGVWHGVETQKDGINLLWIVTPPGLEGFFREIGSPIGSPAKTLTPAQIQDIGRKHGVSFKQQ
jgi:quercetin dioxygenase-like cupin family protein